MTTVMTIEKHYPVSVVAKALGKSQRTIRRWIEAGKIKAAELPGRFDKPSYAIPRSELDRLGVSIVEDDD